MLQPAHVFLALLVVLVWGFNFVVITFGLRDVSALTLCVARFILAGLPILFVPRPTAPFRAIVSYGLLTFVLQFTLLFSAMQSGISAGLASLLLQSQVFFTLLLAILFLHETPNRWQTLGALVAFVGIAVIGVHLGNDLNLLSFLMVLIAAITWAGGNLIAKSFGKVNMLPIVIWASFISWPPLLLVTVLYQGATATFHDFSQFTWVSGSALLYIVVLSTWFGYGVWNKLLSHYTVVAVAPFTLLVPVVGMFSSAMVLHEAVPPWKFLASLIILLGLAINVFGASGAQKLRCLQGRLRP